jgi:hypothetical protein
VCQFPLQVINKLIIFPFEKPDLILFIFPGLPEFYDIINCFEIEVGKNVCAKLVYHRLIRLGYMSKDER